MGIKKAELGTFVAPDGWSCGAKLEEDLDEFCPFRLEGPGLGILYAVHSVEITGRRVHYPPFGWDKGRVRARVTFSDPDGGPGEKTGAWMEVK